MVTLDHTRYDVVGIVTQMGLSQNAQIKGIGLSDRETGDFIPVLSVDRNRVFPTRGNVFAYDFLKHNPGWENECVCLCVKPNNNQNIVNGEDYVWDWKDDPYIYADRIKKLKTPLSEDGGFNNELFRKEGILPCEEVTYFISGDNIYRLDPGARLLPFWKVSDVSSSLFVCNGLTYLFNDLQENEVGKLDLTSDEQLIEKVQKDHEDEIAQINSKHEKRLNDLDTQFRLDKELLHVQIDDKRNEPHLLQKQQNRRNHDTTGTRKTV